MSKFTDSFTLPADAQARLEMLAQHACLPSREDEGREPSKKSGGKKSFGSSEAAP